MIANASSRLVREQQMADRLNIKQRLLRKWREQRIVPFVKVGRTILFDENKVLDALKGYERHAASNLNHGVA
jgi:excisionase family DNA binding protein